MRIAMVLTSILIAWAANAGTPDILSYNQITAGYQLVTGNRTPDGLFLTASYGLTGDFYVAGGFDHLGAGKVSLETLSARAGYRVDLRQDLDLYAEVGLASMNADISILGPVVSDSDLGLWLEGGARTAFSADVAGHAGLRLLTGDYDEQVLFIQGVHALSTQWSASAELARMLDAAEFRLQLGVRYNL